MKYPEIPGTGQKNIHNLIIISQYLYFGRRSLRLPAILIKEAER